MPDVFQVVFVSAGDGSPGARRRVAEAIASATKADPERILKSIEAAPFVYKKGLPQVKADGLARALTKLGAETVVQPEGSPLPAAPVTAPAANVGSAPAASFDFGAQADSAGGGYSFGEESPASNTGSSAPASGFDFGGSPSAATPEREAPVLGGFAFGSSSPPAKPSADAEDFGFQLADSNPSQSASGAGFSFTAEAAAPVATKPSGPSLVERNLDYAASAPPPASEKKPPSAETTECPRCNHSQPRTNVECENCHVVMAKATVEEGAAPQPRRRTTARPVKGRRSSFTAPFIGLLALAALGVVGLLLGLHKPLMLKLKSTTDPLLKSYGVSLEPPLHGVSYVRVADPAKAEELRSSFLALSDYIGTETARMGTLASVAEFDAAKAELDPYVSAYLGHEAQTLKQRVIDVTAPYYKLDGVGLTLDDTTYLTDEEIRAAKLEGSASTKSILNDFQIGEALKVARQQAVQREASGARTAFLAAINQPLAERFQEPLSQRWEWLRRDKARFSLERSQLVLATSGGAFPSGTVALLSLPEPTVDYAAEVKIDGAPGAGARGALVIYQDDTHLLAFARTTTEGRVAAQVFTTTGDLFAPGYHDFVTGPALLRIERRQREYRFQLWDARTRSWRRLDSLQPEWDDRVQRRLGLAAVGDAGVTFTFSDFSLKLL